jgi:hypothetical protein
VTVRNRAGLPAIELAVDVAAGLLHIAPELFSGIA